MRRGKQRLPGVRPAVRGLVFYSGATWLRRQTAVSIVGTPPPPRTKVKRATVVGTDRPPPWVRPQRLPSHCPHCRTQCPSTSRPMAWGTKSRRLAGPRTPRYAAGTQPALFCVASVCCFQCVLLILLVLGFFFSCSSCSSLYSVVVFGTHIAGERPLLVCLKGWGLKLAGGWSKLRTHLGCGMYAHVYHSLW